MAAQLAQCLQAPHVELDALHWLPDWQECPPDVFRERAAAALAGESWVVDGNYGKVRDIVWKRADTLVWLDYPLLLVLWRLLRRTIRRIRSQELLWGTNRESWRDQFISRHSLFLWVLKAQPRHRRDYPVLLARPEYRHLRCIRLTSPRAAQHWLESLNASG